MRRASTRDTRAGATEIDTRPQQPTPLTGGPVEAAGPAQRTGVMVLCTYCGSLSVSTSKCSGCGGHFDMLSRQRTQNAMGPWFIRDQVNPFHPGCSYDTLRRMVARGKVRPDTVMRGPTTRQFWSFARNTPGVAHLLGACHACYTEVDPNAAACPSCNASFIVINDRQHLGLAPLQMLPGDTDPSAVADAAFGPGDTAANVTRPSPPPVASENREEAGRLPAQHAATTRRPTRKRSAGPAIAVATSVLCAAVVLTALVIMNRSDGGRALASAAEPSAQLESEPVTATDTPAVQMPTEPQPEATNAPDAADDEMDRTADAGDDPDPVPSQPVVESSEPATPTDSTVRREASIGSMSPEQLIEARADWAQDGRDDLVSLVDRRRAQLALRSMFGAQSDSLID